METFCFINLLLIVGGRSVVAQSGTFRTDTSIITVTGEDDTVLTMIPVSGRAFVYKETMITAPVPKDSLRRRLLPALKDSITLPCRLSIYSYIGKDGQMDSSLLLSYVPAELTPVIHAILKGLQPWQPA
jgi:hypothetical protein